MPRVLIFATAYPPQTRAGGPAQSIKNLVAEVSDHLVVDVIAPDRDLGDRHAVYGRGGLVVNGNVSVHHVRPRRPTELIKTVRKIRGEGYRIVLVNSIWNRQMAFLPALLRLAGVLKAETMVLMPRGELEPGALNLHAGRKRVGMPFVTKVYRRAIDAFGATSPDEMRDLRRWMPHKRVIMTAPTPDEMTFQARNPIEKERFALLFLGRIHPTKGLLELLLGLENISVPLRLSIAGPVGDATYWGQCKALISRIATSNANVNIDYLGPLEREGVQGVLHQHDAMACLTAGENFGHALAESLQCGCPLIVTRVTPWTPHLMQGGGWLVNDRTSTTEVTEILMEAAGQSLEDRRGKRREARDAYERWRTHKPINVIDAVLNDGAEEWL